MEFSVASGSLDSPEALLAQNEALKIRIQELQVQNSSVNAIQNQNSEMLSLLGRTSANLSVVEVNSSSTDSNGSSTSNVSVKPLSTLTPLNNRILGAVLVRPPLAPYDELIIDVGSNEGVISGAPVYAPGNILIGTTTDVLGETTKVTLFSSSGQTYPVSIGSAHIPALAIGRGGGQYEAQVPQATQISQGDIVSDSVLNNGSFGTVTAVLNNPSDPFETILFSPPINIYQLRFVLVSHATTTKAKK